MSTPRKPRRLFTMLGELPGMVSELVRAELALLKAEIVGKLKLIGLGAGFIVVALVLLLLFLGVLLTSAVLALALVMPGWLAALVVAFVLLLMIGLLVLLGIRQFKKAMPPLPERTIDSVQRDWYSITGVLSRVSAASVTMPRTDRPGPTAPRTDRWRTDERSDEQGDRP